MQNKMIYRKSRKNFDVTALESALAKSNVETFRLVKESRSGKYERVFKRADFRDAFEDVYAVALTGYYYGRKSFYIALYEAE